MAANSKTFARASLISLVRKRDTSEGITIALDIDEVLAEVHEVMLRLYNKEKGTNYTLADHKDWDFKSINSNYAEMMGFYVDAWKDHWKEIRFLGDRQKLIKVEQVFVQDICSSRDYYGLTGGTTKTAKEWLSMHKLNWLPFFFDATKIKKLALGYPIYVDDSPKLAEEVEKRGEAFILLVDKPYNRYLSNTRRILRVDGINAAADELLRAADAAGLKKKYYQTQVGQRFLREGMEARDRIIAEAMSLNSPKL